MIDTTAAPETSVQNDGQMAPPSNDSAGTVDPAAPVLEAPEESNGTTADSDPVAAWTERCASWVRTRPMTALLAGFGLGMLMGRMTR